MTAPVNPEAVKTGQQAVFVAVKNAEGKIVMSRGQITLADYGSYMMIEVKL